MSYFQNISNILSHIVVWINLLEKPIFLAVIEDYQLAMA